MEIRLDAGTGEVDTDTVTVDQHWCLTEDGTRVVPETHPDARFLWASPGTVVPRAEAERLGAVKPEVKQKPAPANKQAAKPQTKAARDGV